MITKRFKRRAFTLVEMLLVMAIITVLTSVSVLAMKSLMGSTGLTGAGDKVSAFFAFARQEAISKNTITAAVILTKSSLGTPAYRTYSVWELVLPADDNLSDATWVQASKWQTLPNGVVIDNSTLAATANNYLSSTTVTPALPTMNYLGTTLNPATDCAVQIFLPSGRIDPPSNATPSTANNPIALQLAEGFYNGSTITYQHPNATNSALPANYVDYYFSAATGEPKIVRP
jgi:prepilin-type N-terminal cleavage/methylation domain-containing protein